MEEQVKVGLTETSHTAKKVPNQIKKSKIRKTMILRYKKINHKDKTDLKIEQVKIEEDENLKKI